MPKTAFLWALAGANVGILIAFIFLGRPAHEFDMPAPFSSRSYKLDVPGPKTIAEATTGVFSWILGTTVTSLLIIFVLPKLQNEYIEVKELRSNLIVGLIISIAATCPILPFSLKILKRR